MDNGKSVYRAELSTHELIETIRILLDEQRRAERLVCRYLADFAGRVDARGADVPSGYADIYHASRCLFGVGVGQTRERVRVGRALRGLPRIEGALVDGTITYSRAREVARVARPEDEDHWLELARALPMRDLERCVIEAGGGTGEADRTKESAEVHW